jgi:putative ABC transport system ATP-binding protein
VNLTPRADTSPRDPQVVRLTAGQELFAQGEQGDLVYTVDEGEIEIVRARDDGTIERVARVEAGDYFGGLAPMFGLLRWWTAGAGGPGVVAGYGLRDFRERFDVPSPRVLARSGRLGIHSRFSALGRYNLPTADGQCRPSVASSHEPIWD